MLPNKKKITTGGYSLIFHPAIDKEGKEIQDLNFVSKIQIPSLSSENEIIISETIKCIKNYTYHFSPVLSHTDISLSHINRIMQEFDKEEPNEFQDIKNILCGNHDIPTDTCVHMMIPYVGHLEYHQYISKLLHSLLLIHKFRYSNTKHENWHYNTYIQYGIEKLYDKNCLTKEFICSRPLKQLSNDFLISFMDGFSHLLDSISLLLDKRIVHNDVKDQNILYDEEKCYPILIDFGLSLPIQNLKDPTSYEHYFFVYKPSYFIWCPDIHFINYLIHENENPQHEHIEQFVYTYIEHLRKHVSLFFSKEQLETYTENLIQYYSSFYTRETQPDTFISNILRLCNITKNTDYKIDKSHIIKYILRNYKKWDLHSLCIFYISIFSTIHKNTYEYHKYYQTKLNLTLSNKHMFDFDNTLFYQKINKLFFDILQPNYQISDYKKEFLKIKSLVQDYIHDGLQD